MGFHQSGSGSSYPTTNSPDNVGPINNPGIYSAINDAYQISDPIYSWGNTGPGAGIGFTSYDDGSTGGLCNNTNPATGNTFTTPDFMLLGRDLFVDQGAKPGWAPYTYPHPKAAALGEVAMAAPPEMSPIGTTSNAKATGTLNTYPGAVTVTLTSPLTSGSFHICYTTNGSTPTAATPGTCDSHSGVELTYSSPFSVSSSATVNAITTEVGMTNSFVANNLYTINGTTQLATPTMSPAAGSYASASFPLSVTLTCPSGATCHYTTDSSAPTSSSTTYSGAFFVPEAMNVNAIAVQSGKTTSLMGSALYQIGASVSLSPLTESFGLFNVGSSSSPVTFTITNSSGTTATSISISDTDSAEFPITNSGAGSCAAAGGSLVNGTSCTFSVLFSPTSAGLKSPTLTVTYSGGDGASPITASLSGTGVSATAPAAQILSLLLVSQLVAAQ